MNEQWRDGNDVELLINGEAFFPRVFDCIRNAKREVFLETFIFHEDKVGKELQEALITAAKRGVRIEATVDDYGSNDLSPEFINQMVEVGVNLHVFDPTPRLMGARINIFRRLHRKIVVVDGEVAFVGGINFVADQLANSGPHAKEDFTVQLRGPIVQDVRDECIQLLQCGSRKSKKIVSPIATQNNSPASAAGDAKVLLAVRDNTKHKNAIEQHYLRAIHSAQHRLVIANAYFFPGIRFLRAIRKAARRGVDVTLILQGQPDMQWVSALSRLLYGYLLKSGVKIHEYCQRPLHGKVAIMDDSWATIGSSNLDPLSLALNLEANVMIQSTAFNQQLYEHLHGLAEKQCKPMDMKIARTGYWWRMPFIFLSFHFLRHFPAMVGWLPVHTPVVQLLKSSQHQNDSPESDQPSEHISSEHISKVKECSREEVC